MPVSPSSSSLRSQPVPLWRGSGLHAPTLESSPHDDSSATASAGVRRSAADADGELRRTSWRMRATVRTSAFSADVQSTSATAGGEWEAQGAAELGNLDDFGI